jgi:NAD-dependent SIR2 family protein deacetylase
MADVVKTYYCEKCNRTLNANEFYKSNNLEKYPHEGKFPKCKKCMTMHVNNWDPNTYLWILQEADVPYVPAEWNKLMATYGKDASKMSGMTIVGRYLGKM